MPFVLFLPGIPIVRIAGTSVSRLTVYGGPLSGFDAMDTPSPLALGILISMGVLSAMTQYDATLETLMTLCLWAFGPI